MNHDKDPEREQFEKWISSPPYEQSIERLPPGYAAYPWTAEYVNVNVQMAWESWRESRNTLLA